ncbi:MAG: flagellar protein FliS [Lachnospiraceae bacterium]|nr:flagellar protein FliS [Lachnospiraceae bacterium]
MRDDLKKQYAMRISQANNVEMILIGYEMTDTYLCDAVNDRDDKAVYRNNLDMAGKCIDEMLANLHYEYEPAAALKKLYLYMKIRLRDAKYNGDLAAIEEVRAYLNRLHESYESVKDRDTSVPVMKNTQEVVTGITYGKNQILDELSNDVSKRGFLV